MLFALKAGHQELSEEQSRRISKQDYKYDQTSNASFLYMTDFLFTQWLKNILLK